MNKPILYSEEIIQKLKLSAKRLKRETGVPHHEALDKVAQGNGFHAWSHLMQYHQKINRDKEKTNFSEIHKNWDYFSDQSSYCEEEYWYENYLKFIEKTYLIKDLEISNVIKNHNFRINGRYLNLTLKSYIENKEIIEENIDFIASTIEGLLSCQFAFSLSNQEMEVWLTSKSKALGNRMPMEALEDLELSERIWSMLSKEQDNLEDDSLLRYVADPLKVPESVRHLVKDMDSARKNKEEIFNCVLTENIKNRLRDFDWDIE